VSHMVCRVTRVSTSVTRVPLKKWAVGDQYRSVYKTSSIL